MNAFLEFVPFNGGSEKSQEETSVRPSPFEDTEVSEESEVSVTGDTEQKATMVPNVSRRSRLNPFSSTSEVPEREEGRPVPKVNDTIHDRYIVRDKIGDGAFGKVFEVQHRMLGQTFALKTLSAKIGRDPDVVAQFVEEAKTTSLIGHENIVFVTDFGVCPRFGHYLVMEYLDGATLEDLIEQRGRLDLDETVEFVLSVGNALGAVHELGIVHRDLKPANVMRSTTRNKGGVWKVVDFGISTAVSKGGLSGTPAYMPPEQALGGEVDGRADQFALAAIIYEMLTGDVPWETRSWLDALGEERVKKPVPDLHKVRPDLPAAVAGVVNRGLSLDREDRYPSMEAFVAAFKGASDHEHLPTMDPFDVRETARQLEQAQQPHVQPEGAGEAFGPSLSVVTLIDDLTVGVTFQSLSRFKREYRRNIVAGGLFVPTNKPLPERSFAFLTVSVKGYDATAEFRAMVVSCTRGNADSPPGFGVALDEQSSDELQTFLQSLESGFDNRPDAPIKLQKRLDEAAQGLNAAQAFFLSRIDDQMTVGRARAMFAALPFEFEETIQSLIAGGYMVVGDADVTQRGSRLECDSKEMRFSPMEVETVLERAEYFESQHNYLGARELLEEAARHAPNAAELHHRLARLQLRFDGNITGAFESVRRAVELEPENAQYRATERLVTMIRKRRG